MRISRALRASVIGSFVPLGETAEEYVKTHVVTIAVSLTEAGLFSENPYVERLSIDGSVVGDFIRNHLSGEVFAAAAA